VPIIQETRLIFKEVPKFSDCSFNVP
jgi:hypothetical protein